MAYNRKEEYLAVVKQPKQITDELLETIDYIARARDAENKTYGCNYKPYFW